MNQTALFQIEKKILRLSRYEQLWLAERIIRHLRKPDKPDFESQLRAMASDPDIRRESDNIGQEFLITESDGLENL